MLPSNQYTRDDEVDFNALTPSLRFISPREKSFSISYYLNMLLGVSTNISAHDQLSIAADFTYSTRLNPPINRLTPNIFERRKPDSRTQKTGFISGSKSYNIFNVSTTKHYQRTFIYITFTRLYLQIERARDKSKKNANGYSNSQVRFGGMCDCNSMCKWDIQKLKMRN